MVLDGLVYLIGFSVLLLATWLFIITKMVLEGRKKRKGSKHLRRRLLPFLYKKRKLENIQNNKEEQ